MKIYDKLDIITDILLQNQCFIELIHGYCLCKSDFIDEMNNLLIILDIVLKNQENLRSNIEEIDLELYKIQSLGE